MRTEIMFTLTGPDRVGIVEEVTSALLQVDANVETSRMVRLGGEFATLMLLSLPAEKVSGLDDALSALVAHGYKVTTTATSQRAAHYAGWSSFTIEVAGADHEGIVHEIARGLSQRGITIESADTSVSSAAVTGLPLFAMTAEVLVPPALVDSDWIADVIDAGETANVDVAVTAHGA